MITFQAADLIRILPEIVLALFGVVIMVLEPFVPSERKKLLGWTALLGVACGGGATLRTSLDPGLAFGGSIAADGFSIFFIYLFLLVAALVILGSMDYLERDHAQHGEFYSLVLLGTVGMCFMATSTDLIMIFLGLEISSISTYILAGFRRTDKLSNEAALKYFLLGSFATAFFLYGIAFVYGLTGTTNLLGAGARLGEPGQWTVFARVALVLMFVGLGFKLSTVPFQIWTPDVYQGAPAPVSAFLSVGPKAAAFAILLRLFLASFSTAGAVAFPILWVSAALTMCLGNLAALRQTNVKRLLAYSSIAHAGYILVGVAAGGSRGMSAVMFYLVAYALMNVGAFILVAHS
jgi:NADH-quinone oxidoreductase subunit N